MVRYGSPRRLCASASLFLSQQCDVRRQRCRRIPLSIHHRRGSRTTCAWQEMDREHRALRPRELLASVSPVEAEQPEEVGGIDEDLPSVTEASLAAEITPSGCGLGKVACGDVMPDLVPFGRRQYAP